nr:MAG TPA: hypothetical protein [Caudoviricetes sp.]
MIILFLIILNALFAHFLLTMIFFYAIFDSNGRED